MVSVVSVQQQPKIRKFFSRRRTVVGRIGKQLFVANHDTVRWRTHRAHARLFGDVVATQQTVGLEGGQLGVGWILHRFAKTAPQFLA